MGDDYSGGGGGGAAGIAMMIVPVCIGLVFMIGFSAFYGFCIKKIAGKVGKEVGILAYIPILQIFPLLSIVGWESWKIVLFLIPFAGIYFAIMFYIELCKVRGKNPWMTVMALIPCTAWAFLPYLAFSE